MEAAALLAQADLIAFSQLLPQPEAGEGLVAHQMPLQRVALAVVAMMLRVAGLGLLEILQAQRRRKEMPVEMSACWDVEAAAGLAQPDQADL